MDKRLFERIKKDILLRLNKLQGIEISDDIDLEFISVPFKIEEVCRFENDEFKTDQYYLRVIVDNFKLELEPEKKNGVTILKAYVTIDGERKLCAFMDFFNLKSDLGGFLEAGKMLYSHAFEETENEKPSYVRFSLFFPYKEILKTENGDIVYDLLLVDEEEMKKITENDLAFVCAFPKIKEE